MRSIKLATWIGLLCLPVLPFRAFAVEPILDFFPLPSVLTADILTREGAVEYTRLHPDAPMDTLAPIGGDLRFNGVALPRAETLIKLEAILRERHLARLPDGTRIETGVDSEGRAVWRYPTGTRVYHLSEFRAPQTGIHELRVLQKRSDGTWAYGVYSPMDNAPDAPLLVLQTYPEPTPVKVFRVREGAGQVTLFSHFGVRLGACRDCHFERSPSAYQYPSAALAGPCGFVPANSSLLTQWAERYRERHGHSPF